MILYSPEDGNEQNHSNDALRLPASPEIAGRACDYHQAQIFLNDHIILFTMFKTLTPQMSEGDPSGSTPFLSDKSVALTRQEISLLTYGGENLRSLAKRLQLLNLQ